MLPKAVGQASEGSRFWDDAHIKAFSPFQPKTVAIVDRIDAGITPPLFYLKNLLKKKIRGPYYKEQLLLIAEKDIPKYLVVNTNFKIRNTTNDKEEFLVNFVGQPYQYKKWLKKSDFVENG